MCSVWMHFYMCAGACGQSERTLAVFLDHSLLFEAESLSWTQSLSVQLVHVACSREPAGARTSIQPGVHPCPAFMWVLRIWVLWLRCRAWASGPSLWFPHLLIWDKVSHWAWGSLLARLAGQPAHRFSVSPVLELHMWSSRAWILHGYVAGTLPTELSPQLPKLNFYVRSG